MPRKLHSRFRRVDPWDRDSFHCFHCDKVRAICGDCDHCSDCCMCCYCDRCGLPNGIGSHECTCFQCEACNRTFRESDQVVDDGDYTTDMFDSRKPLQYICTGCFAIRKARALGGKP